MTRHERRRRLTNLHKIVAVVGRNGLPPAAELVDISALVSLIDDSLSHGPARGRSRRALELISTLHDVSIRNGPDFASLACAEGCHLCCDMYVSAPAPRIFAIADFIRETADDLGAEIARIAKADRATRGRTAEERAETRVFCPLLVDGLCSVYPVRPSGCQAFCSLSLAACQAEAVDSSVPIPMPDYTHPLRARYDQALSAALHGNGLDTTSYELVHALLVALDDPGAEEKWFRGEDVFAGVGTDTGGKDALPEGMAEHYWDCLWNVAQGEAPPDGPFTAKFPQWCRD